MTAPSPFVLPPSPMYTIQDPLIKSLDIKINKLVTSNFLWTYKTAFKGQGIEFSNIRPYDFGDPYKSIDRVTTAKKGELHIKEYEEERQLNIQICCDIGQSMQFGTGWWSIHHAHGVSSPTPQTKHDTMLQLYYIITLAAIANNDRVGTVMFDDEIREVTKLSKQKSALYKNVKYMTHIHEQQWSSYTSNLNKALERLFRTKFSHGLIVILSDDYQHIDAKLIKILAQKNELLYIYITDVFENTLSIWERAGQITSDIQLRSASSTLTINPLSATAIKYRQARQQQITQLKQSLQKRWADFLMIDNTMSIGTELLRYFMNK